MKIVAYYTSDDIYHEHFLILKKNLQGFNLDYFFKKIEPNSWLSVTSFKPKFIKNCLDQFQDDILYIDIDCIIHNDISVYFNELDENIHIAAHKNEDELLSGVVFFRDSKQSQKILDMWIEGMEKNPSVWDQKVLERIIKDNDIQFYNLPVSFLYIFDKSKIDHPNLKPVIEHLQASREKKFQEKNFSVKYKILKYIGIKPKVGKYLHNRRVKMNEVREKYLIK